MQLIDDLVTENAELQQQLQSSTELTRAVETAKREQQEIQEMREQVSLVTLALHVVCETIPTYKCVLVRGLPWDFPHSIS